MTRASSVLLLDLGLLTSDEDVPNTGRILRVSSTTRHVEPIIENQQLPDSIDAFNQDGRIFRTCVGFLGAPDGSV